MLFLQRKVIGINTAAVSAIAIPGVTLEIHMTSPKSENNAVAESNLSGERETTRTHVYFHNPQDTSFAAGKMRKGRNIHQRKLPDFYRFTDRLRERGVCAVDVVTPTNCGGKSVVACRDVMYTHVEQSCGNEDQVHTRENCVYI